MKNKLKVMSIIVSLLFLFDILIYFMGVSSMVELFDDNNIHSNPNGTLESIRIVVDILGIALSTYITLNFR